MENRIYQIIIICLLIVLAIFLVKGQPGHYQISGDKVLNTGTGEIYGLEHIAASDGQAWVWVYIGKPRRDFNYEERTIKILKDIKEKSSMKYLRPLEEPKEVK
jgi:hypothetical protein